MPRRGGRSLDHDEDSSSSSSSHHDHDNGSDNRASYGSSCGIKSVNEYQHKLLAEKQVGNVKWLHRKMFPNCKARANFVRGHVQMTSV